MSKYQPTDPIGDIYCFLKSEYGLTHEDGRLHGVRATTTLRNNLKEFYITERMGNTRKHPSGTEQDEKTQKQIAEIVQTCLSKEYIFSKNGIAKSEDIVKTVEKYLTRFKVMPKKNPAQKIKQYKTSVVHSCIQDMS